MAHCFSFINSESRPSESGSFCLCRDTKWGAKWGAMAKNKLSAAAVRKSEGKLFDGGGLYLMKRNANGGFWSYRFKIDGRSREMGLGSYPDVGLAEARDQRDKWQAVLRNGEDPIIVRDLEKRATLGAYDPTFAVAAELTLQAKSGGLRGGGKAGRWMSPLALYVTPKIGAKRMSQIHQRDVYDAILPIWKEKHPTATKAIQRTKLVFAHARLSGAQCDPFTIEAAQHMLGEHIHTVTPTPASEWQAIPAVYDRLHLLESSHLCLRFKMLTVMRSKAVRNARFDQIEENVWTVPADLMKGKEGVVQAHRVPLCTAAIETVNRARKVRRSDYLFPGPSGRPISDVALTKTFRKADPTGTPHGLRSSFKSWASDNDVSSYDVIETALGHIVGGKVERSYMRSDLLDRRRLLMDAWARFVTGSEQNLINLRA